MAAFVKLLNELRVGNASREAICIFKALERKVHYDDDVEPTSLFAKRTQVLAENARRLKQLSGENIAYRAHDVAGFRKAMDEETLRATLDKVG